MAGRTIGAREAPLVDHGDHRRDAYERDIDEGHHHGFSAGSHDGIHAGEQ